MEAMETMQVHPIGRVRIEKDGMFVDVDRAYLPALTELDGFSQIMVVWWFSYCDDEASRSRVLLPKPYQKAPELVGVFATRAPERPNPIALSTAQVLHIDHATGSIRLAYIDADDGTPVLDIKPYTPSLDRVEKPRVPSWCAHWPKCYERSGEFDWESEFLFD